MRIEFRKWITREMLQAERDKVFVFGDNITRTGFGGQARQMRGEPNAIGVPTKRRPSNDPDAFMTGSFEDILFVVSGLRLVANAAATGKTVVWPEDGIGTGLADLSNRAPHLQRLIGEFVKALEAAA